MSGCTSIVTARVLEISDVLFREAPAADNAVALPPGFEAEDGAGVERWNLRKDCVRVVQTGRCLECPMSLAVQYVVQLHDV